MVWVENAQVEHSKHMSEAEKRIQHAKDLHKASVRRAMESVASGSDSALSHVVFGAWRETWQDRVSTDRTRQHLKDHSDAHSFVLDKAIMKWTQGDANALKHSILHVWTTYSLGA